MTKRSILKIGTREFEKKNARRLELIEKRVEEGNLSEMDEAEFQRLQVEILNATSQAFPYPQEKK